MLEDLFSTSLSGRKESGGTQTNRNHANLLEDEPDIGMCFPAERDKLTATLIIICFSVTSCKQIDNNQLQGHYRASNQRCLHSHLPLPPAASLKHLTWQDDRLAKVVQLTGHMRLCDFVYDAWLADNWPP